MSAIRDFQARVAKMERAKASASPFVSWYDSFAAFEEKTQGEIDAGKLCPHDMPIILHVLRRFGTDGTWESWSRDRIWQTAQ
jgi:hypothetical protein